MKAIRVSEIFYSLQGEGRYVGVPSVFLRTFGCNFTCSGFGMPKGEKSVERDLVDPLKFVKYSDLPLVKTGCDSYASWDPRFKKFSKHYTIPEIGEVITSLLPPTMNGGFEYLTQSIHLVITGGEPLLGWQKLYPELLGYLETSFNLRHVTFETNGTQKLTDDFQHWIQNDTDIDFTFSVSPKLSVSGEKWKDAIKPESILSYRMATGEHEDTNVWDFTVNPEAVYLKFVVDKPADLMEVFNVSEEISCTVHHNLPIYLMPVGGTGDLYYQNNKRVADMALSYGWRYSPRIQVDLWKNAWGT